ncbi:oligopeptidase A [Gallaecimonas sp. GXIMD4217]|uniref:oligopeptidase A n=1 Tax=Gallaecimonas sp. GXIMD4217 TaxID=3131927 RepID=UPI00311B428E
MSNPLLQTDGLPPFSQIKPEHVKPAVEALLADCRAAVEAAVAAGNPGWETLVAPIEEADDRLSKAWSPVSHLNSVMSSPELREAYESCLPLLSEYGTWVGQHQGLYQAYKHLAESEQYHQLSAHQRKVVDNALRDFKLSGVALEDEAKVRFGQIRARQSELASKYSNNLLDATNAWHKHITDEAQLAGLPDSAREMAAELAQAKELDGWLLTLDIPCYIAVMSYADDRALREEMYQAYVTRASDQGPHGGSYDNSAIMAETLALRHELAGLLGFGNYAELSLATKMADDSGQVLDFLHDLARRSKPQGEQERDEIIAFARELHGLDDLKPWDYGYYGEKLKESRYSVNAELLRPYFPETRVLPGLFEVVNRLFGISVREVEGVDVWHPDVRYFEIYDESGTRKGAFYLDLYAREKKRGGAWMDECRVQRIKADGELQLPVAYLVCNFSRPTGGKPALFTHEEVVTLFHEFGHGLHHMLTRVTEGAVSGINGVAWDAVELPSQFLENWCWEKQALNIISGHHQSGEPLPEQLLANMLEAKHFQSAMMMLRQLEFALFDFRLHLEYDPALGDRIQATLDEVREEVSVVEPPAFNRFQHSFGHIFAGGYAAGYYSYKWAEVLSADAFSRFEEEGIFNEQTGRDFLHCILEKGGSEEPAKLFADFRGREPQVDALLRHSGIAP